MNPYERRESILQHINLWHSFGKSNIPFLKQLDMIYCRQLYINSIII